MLGIYQSFTGVGDWERGKGISSFRTMKES